MSRGELAPGLRGRTDTTAYATALGKARNVITKPTGGAVKRPGTIWRGRVRYPDRLTRLIPFVYSTVTKYLVEAGDQYFRFWVNGALLVNSTKAIVGITNANPAVVTAMAHGFTNGEPVVIDGVRGMDWINGRTFTIAVLDPNTFQLVGANTTSQGVYAGGGEAGQVVEVATPYTSAMLRAVRFTQSADVLYLAHQQVPIMELRRITGSRFDLVPFDFRRGPFRPFNLDEAAVMAASGNLGEVTLTTNVDVFTAGMVGQLVYLEEKELRGVKPWASGEKNVPLGALRRSDQKVYRVSAIPSSLGTEGTPYYITGSTRPTHTIGRAFDGPQDVKSDGVNDYAVGVEWEFVHNTFGIVKITGITDSMEAKAVVIERIPDSIVGTAPSPVDTWSLDGDGGTLQFAIPGAGSPSPLDYTVTINGVPVQQSPYYPGGGGVDGAGGGAPGPRDSVKGQPFNTNVA